MPILKSFDNITERINEVQMIDDNIINFNYNNYKITLIAEADCCSKSWFEEYKNYNFKDLVGYRIKSITFNNENNDNDIIEKYKILDNDEEKYYIYEIKVYETDEIFKFILRNSSNGYYGGYLEIVFNEK